MTVYVDTSVTLRVLFHEPHPLSGWGKWTAAYASRIWHTEALRTLDRARLLAAIDDPQVVQLRRDIELIHSVFHIIPVTERILARAGEAFPTVVGTLDAIHLASALHLRDTLGLDTFLTHDAQLAAAAIASGLTVQGL
jgi:predicted nucleic acid-binding protein